VKVAALVAAAECMGAATAAALVLQMVRLPEHRPFIANIFLFLLCSAPILLMFHMLPLCSENCAKSGIEKCWAPKELQRETKS
jgi:hypothetical protein